MAVRFESPISFVTRSSSPTTPSSGYGVMYARGSNLYYEDDTGTEYLLNRAGSTVIRQYTGSAFWIKPPEIVEVLVCCLGAGGGGGSGRVSSASIAASGGGGAGGGALAFRRFTGAQLTAPSYSISIGSGGNGGSSQTTDSTNGLNGSNGTATTFAISGSTTLVSARFGGGGFGGTTTAGAGGNGAATTSNIPVGGWYGFTSANGANGFISTGNNSPNTFLYNAGAGAGGVTAAGAPGAGGLGSSLPITGSTFTNNGSGSLSSPNATTNTSRIRTDFLFNFVVTDGLQFGMGFSGNGGAGQTTANGGSGSAAAPYGGGGGGGGGCRDGFDSGAGGRGADGLVTIVEFY